jgi:KaiC/GvpD/RAD55 family RecA-like ATPase
VEFQCAIVNLSLSDKFFFLKLKDLLQPSWLGGNSADDSEILQWVWNRILEYNLQYKDICSIHYLKDKVSRINENKKTLYINVLNKIEKGNTFFNAEYIKQNITDFIQEQMYLDKFYSSANLFKKGKQQEAIDLFKNFTTEMSKLDFNENVKEPFESIFSLLEIAKNSRINAVPTGITELDKILGGGLLPQTMTVMLAVVNAGKSSFCRTLVYNSILAQKKVVLFVLEDEEIPTKIKLLSCFSGINYDKLTKGIEILNDTEKSLLENSRKLIEKYLVLKFMYGKDRYIEKVEEFCEMYSTTYGKIDLLIVDSAQNLATRTKTDNTFERMSEVFERLKQLSNTLNLASFSPVQGTREGVKLNKLDNNILKSEQISQSINIFQSSSNFLTLNRSENNKKENKILFYLEKQREGITGQLIECRSNFSIQRAYEGNTSKIVEIKDTKNVEKVNKNKTMIDGLS